MSGDQQNKHLPILGFLERKQPSNKNNNKKHQPFTLIGHQLVDKKYVVYEFQLYHDGHIWNLKSRYRELSQLKGKLTCQLKLNLNFPSKVFIGNLKPEVTEQRAKELNAFLNDVIQRKQTFESQAFQQFLNEKRSVASCVEDITSKADFDLDN